MERLDNVSDFWYGAACQEKPKRMEVASLELCCFEK